MFNSESVSSEEVDGDHGVAPAQVSSLSAKRFDGKFSAVQDATGPEGNVARCCMTVSRMSDRTHSLTRAGMISC